MTVQELFKKTDKEQFFMCYSKNDYTINKLLFDSQYTTKEKIEKINQLKTAIMSSFEKMSTINVKSNKKEIVFAIPFEENGELGWDVFSCKRKEILSAETTESIQKITKYGIEFDSIEDILSYEVSEVCQYLYSNEQLAAAIFDEATFFGLEFNERNAEVEEKLAKINSAIQEIEEGKTETYCSLDDIFKELGFEDKRTQEEREFDLQKTKFRLKNAATLYGMYMEHERNYMISDKTTP